jgi:hypothetical protein
MGFSLGGSKSKSKNKQAQQSTSTTTVDPWGKSQFEKQRAGILDTAQGILGRTQQYTNQPFKAYNGQMVAGMSAGEQQAAKMAQDGSGSAGVLGDAVTAAKDGAAMQWIPEGVLGPDKVDYQTFDPSKLDAWMNPHNDKVMAAQEAYANERKAKDLMGIDADSAQKGAWGSRAEVRKSEIDRTYNMDMNALKAEQLKSAWDGAVAAEERQRNATYGANRDNSNISYQARLVEAQRKDQAAQFGVGQKFQAAGVLSGLASQKDASHAQQFEMLRQSGATDREIEQAKLLATRAEFDRSAKDELDKLMLELQARQGYQQTQQGILSSTPMGQTTTSNGTATSSGTSSSVGFKWS